MRFYWDPVLGVHDLYSESNSITHRQPIREPRVVFQLVREVYTYATLLSYL